MNLKEWIKWAKGTALPDCFGSGDLFNPAGAAENDCYTCPCVKQCAEVSESSSNKEPPGLGGFASSRGLGVYNRR